MAKQRPKMRSRRLKDLVARSMNLLRCHFHGDMTDAPLTTVRTDHRTIGLRMIDLDVAFNVVNEFDPMIISARNLSLLLEMSNIPRVLLLAKQQ